MVFISLCGFYLIRVFFISSLSFSFCILSIFFFFISWTNASSRVDSSSSFSLIRAYFIHISLSLSSLLSLGFQSLSVPFFILLDATFALVYRAWWLLLPFFFLPFQLRAAESSFSFIFVAFIFPPHSTLTSLFVHSAPFASSFPLLYLFPGVLTASVV